MNTRPVHVKELFVFEFSAYLVILKYASVHVASEIRICETTFSLAATNKTLSHAPNVKFEL